MLAQVNLKVNCDEGLFPPRRGGLFPSRRGGWRNIFKRVAVNVTALKILASVFAQKEIGYDR